MRKDWVFKLVGVENFMVGKVRCMISIDAVDGFMYQYSLEVNGKKLEKFTENQSKILKTWQWKNSGKEYRVVLGEKTLGFYNSKIQQFRNSPSIKRDCTILPVK